MPDDGPIPPLFGVSMRLPPSNIQAEQALLGAVLANNKAFDRCNGLEPEHFADPINGRIYQEARKLYDAGRLADAVTLKTTFENAGILDEVGGTRYLTQLLSAMVGIINAGDYAQVIQDAWLRRELIGLGENVVNGAFGATEGTADDIASDAMEQLFSLSERGAEASSTSFADAAATAFAQAQATHRGDPGHTRLDVGIATVDKIWNGLWPGQFYIVMARSNTGKTPFMLQLARHCAEQFKRDAEAKGTPRSHVHIWSLEMTAADLLRVNLASTSRWTVDQIQAGQIGDPRDWIELEAASKSLGELPIIIDDPAQIDVGTLWRRTIATKRAKRTRLVLIDFRELIRRGHDQARMLLPEWMPWLCYQLKGLAKAAGVPVVALAQINKAEKGTLPKFPTIDDLPYGGEQAADGVFGLFRPELYMQGDPPGLANLSGEKRANALSVWERQRQAVAGKAQFGVVKRRFGPQGIAWLSFDGPRMKFGDWSLRDHYGAPPPVNEGDYGYD